MAVAVTFITHTKLLNFKEMTRFQKVLKWFLDLIILALYLAGVVGGIINVLLMEETPNWIIAVCIAVLGAMAFPTAKKVFLDLESYRGGGN